MKKSILAFFALLLLPVAPAYSLVSLHGSLIQFADVNPALGVTGVILALGIIAYRLKTSR